jgi:hypothetical protein
VELQIVLVILNPKSRRTGTDGKLPNWARARRINGWQKGKLYFPDSMPPFQYFFPDDQGRLFVMTFEKGETPGSYLYDIFNPDGVFVGRTSLDNSGNEATEIWGGPFEVRAKNDLLYYLRAKPSGYQELVVCLMTWTE